MADKRSTYLPYIPGPPPTHDTEQLTRATWEELYKIAQSLIDLDRPVSVAVRENIFLNVADPPVFLRLFQGDNPEWMQPENFLDPATGIVTIPQSGLYSVQVVLRIPPFVSPNSKDYYGAITTYYTPINTSIQTSWTDVSGGVDDFPITVTSSTLRPLYKGDELYFEAGVTHTQQTGTIETTSNLQIYRVSGIR